MATGYVPPSVKIDVICSPPGQQRPACASEHKHKDTLQMMCSEGIGLADIPETLSKQIRIDLKKWSTTIGDVTYSGQLSQATPVSLPPAMRERIGIPAKATHFCFVYGDEKVCYENPMLLLYSCLIQLLPYSCLCVCCSYTAALMHLICCR